MEKHSNTPNVSLEEEQRKDTALRPSERSFYELFREGGAYSAKYLMNRFDIRDPRSVIRFMRNKGISVVGTWTKQEGRRFKLYSFDRITNSQLNLFN